MKILKRITAVMAATLLMFSASALPVMATEVNDNSPVIMEENNPVIINNEEEAVEVPSNNEEEAVEVPANSEEGNKFTINYYLDGQIYTSKEYSTSDTTFEKLYDSLTAEIEETVQTMTSRLDFYDIRPEDYTEWLPTTSIQNLNVNVYQLNASVPTDYNITVTKVWENLKQPFAFYITDEKGFPIDFYKIEILDENDKVLEEILYDSENRDGLIVKTKESYLITEQYYMNVYFNEGEKYNEEKLPIETVLFQMPDTINCSVYSSQYNGYFMGDVMLSSDNNWTYTFTSSIEPSFDMCIKEITTGPWNSSYSVEQKSTEEWNIIITNNINLENQVIVVRVPAGEDIPATGNPGLPAIAVLIFVGTSLFLGSYYIIKRKK